MIASSYIGLGIYNYYKTRTRIYSDLLIFIEFVINEINYAKSNLYEIIDSFALRHEGAFTKLTSQVKDCLEKGEDITIKCNFLNAGEKMELILFFRTLTKLDRAGLANYFKREQIAASAKIGALKEEEQKNGQLAKNLGILIGIGLLIVVI
jgi:stage III sporulation protein AB